MRRRRAGLRISCSATELPRLFADLRAARGRVYDHVLIYVLKPRLKSTPSYASLRISFLRCPRRGDGDDRREVRVRRLGRGAEQAAELVLAEKAEPPSSDAARSPIAANVSNVRSSSRTKAPQIRGRGAPGRGWAYLCQGCMESVPSSPSASKIRRHSSWTRTTASTTSGSKCVPRSSTIIRTASSWGMRSL
jgi:hypothetical protein